MKNKYVAIIIAVAAIAVIVIYNFSISSADREKSIVLHEDFIYEDPPGSFDREVFADRRDEMMDKTGEGVAVISVAAGDDFFYLTGFEEQRGTAVIINSGDERKFKMFVPPRQPHQTLWYGEVHGVEGAVEKFGADTAYPLESLREELSELLEGQERIFIHSNDSGTMYTVRQVLGETAADGEIVEFEPYIHEMRVTKDKWEITQLRHSVEVTARAHRRAMKTVQPGQKEYDVQAEIEYVFKKNGLEPGFPSIVGSGPNATVLHYRDNDREMKEGDLLLMDVGAESKGGYVADVSRTIPVNGKFSPEQKELYELVLKATDEAIELMTPGNRMLDCHHRATEILTDGLYELGLITDTTKWWQKRFYVHYRKNHYIGLNVHDVGSYGDFDPDDRDSYLLNRDVRGRKIVPGMVMTIEPGIYLDEGRLDHLYEIFGDEVDKEELDAFAEEVRPVYEKYAGTGIRIEDDILITLDGNENLSKNAPRTVTEIERLMSR